MQGSQPLAEGKVRMTGRDIGEGGSYSKPNSSSSAALRKEVQRSPLGGPGNRTSSLLSSSSLSHDSTAFHSYRCHLEIPFGLRRCSGPQVSNMSAS